MPSEMLPVQTEHRHVRRQGMCRVRRFTSCGQTGQEPEWTRGALRTMSEKRRAHRAAARQQAETYNTLGAVPAVFIGDLFLHSQ